MSISSVIECNGCGIKAASGYVVPQRRGQLTDGHDIEFVTVTLPGRPEEKHFCPKCWNLMVMAVRRDTQLPDATGYPV